MRRFIAVTAVLFSGAAMVTTTVPAQADPLVPPMPGEQQFLEHLRQVFPASGDASAFNNDGEQLASGRYACFMRDVNGIVGFEATQISPVVTQLAFIYLCPSAA